MMGVGAFMNRVLCGFPNPCGRVLAVHRDDSVHDSDAHLNIVRARLIEIRDKLTAEAAGPNPSCSAWLQNPTKYATWPDVIALLLDQGKYARALFEWEKIERGRPKTRPAYDITAAVQGPTHIGGPDVYPAGIMVGVNDVGAFYNAGFEGHSYQSEADGPGFYGGNNPRSQAATLLHELAHLIVQVTMMPPNRGRRGLPE
jgi:hypothetical protein